MSIRYEDRFSQSHFHRQIEKCRPFFDVRQYYERENALFSPFFFKELVDPMLFYDDGGVGVFSLSIQFSISRNVSKRLNFG